MFKVISKKNGKIFGEKLVETYEQALMVANYEQKRLKFQDQPHSEKNPYLRDRQEISEMIFDLSQDIEYQEKIRLENIKKESPSLDSMIEALIEEAEGNPEKLTEILMIREEIRLKYPPIKE